MSTSGPQAPAWSSVPADGPLGTRTVPSAAQERAPRSGLPLLFEPGREFGLGFRHHHKGHLGVLVAAEFGALAERLQGSASLFDHQFRRPWASVNFVAAHDGFTLHDLVSYEAKHNEANGEDNRDGHDRNESNNWGTEGPTDDPAILETRGRVARALLATVAFSHGTPMLLGGDEFGRSQGGNNNAYCQDNEISWYDWSLLSEPAGKALHAFTRRVLALRAAPPPLGPRP